MADVSTLLEERGPMMMAGSAALVLCGFALGAGGIVVLLGLAAVASAALWVGPRIAPALLVAAPIAAFSAAALGDDAITRIILGSLALALARAALPVAFGTGLSSKSTSQRAGAWWVAHGARINDSVAMPTQGRKPSLALDVLIGGAGLLWSLAGTALAIGGVVVFLWGGSNTAHRHCLDHRFGSNSMVDTLACIVEH